MATSRLPATPLNPVGSYTLVYRGPRRRTRSDDAPPALPPREGAPPELPPRESVEALSLEEDVADLDAGHAAAEAALRLKGGLTKAAAEAY